MQYLIAVLCVVLGLCTMGGCDKEASRVLATQMEFDKMCNENDGAKAVSMLAPASFEYYDRVMHQARTLKREDLERLAPAQRYNVLYARIYIEPQKLRTINGREYLETIIGSGLWADPDSDARAYLGRIKIYKTYATAGLLRVWDDKPSGHNIYYIKNGDDWQIDLSRFDGYVTLMLEKIAFESELSVDDAVLALLAFDYPGELSESILHPPQ